MKQIELITDDAIKIKKMIDQSDIFLKNAKVYKDITTDTLRWSEKDITEKTNEVIKFINLTITPKIIKFSKKGYYYCKISVNNLDSWTQEFICYVLEKKHFKTEIIEHNKKVMLIINWEIKET